MKVLVACEYSGIVRDAFREFGHDAWSCDIIPTESKEKNFHYQCDVHEVLDLGWDLMIAHPPCTYLCSSGLHWNQNNPERQQLTEDALDFITELWTCNIPRICIENPVGCINTRLDFMPKPQYIQPYQFGEDMSKKTGLWLKNLPPLVPYEEDYIIPRVVERNGRKYNRWANQTDSGQNALPPSETRGKDRSKTPSGVAYAMVENWGWLTD